MNKIISRYEIDVVFIGIGENGHLAFNEPPADVTTKDAYNIVELDGISRRQQVGRDGLQTSMRFHGEQFLCPFPRL